MIASVTFFISSLSIILQHSGDDLGGMASMDFHEVLTLLYFFCTKNRCFFGDRRMRSGRLDGADSEEAELNRI